MSAGVSIGSNVFIPVALLGPGAVVAGGIGLHRRAVALEGVMAVWIGVFYLVTALVAASPAEDLAAVRVVFIPVS